MQKIGEDDCFYLKTKPESIGVYIFGAVVSFLYYV